ncbi:vacuolar protein sorting-associated protein 16B [Toxorhynchites rutilus septentrionalis]|uniref:vacuolar protein sorting-associated protein 16B n=1 Tax=Toxorhynchites rutilus septentrionalis TaxID=329112 RepID=UPI002479BE09|nr:vacuolar protein sorting-associated protein 16B [Toxorhynchites rutilus septentrionalis]
MMESKDEDYWNISANKSFNFDEDDVAVLDVPCFNRRSLFGEDTVSEVNFSNVQSELLLNFIISDENLAAILEDQSRNVVVIPKGVTLEEEVKLLRKKVQETSFAPSVGPIIARMVLGKPCSLEIFRSMYDKETLLDEAISSGNGNAILKVVLFLEKTLKKKLFYRLLQTRQEAVNHYINYMATRLKVTECTDLLVFLGRHHEASLLQFSIFVGNIPNIEFKRQRLKKIYNDYFSQPGANTFYAQLVANYLNLLDFQQSQQLTNDQSVLEILFYICSRYKWGDSSVQSYENPFKLAEAHQVSQSQLEWVALNERAKRQAWLDFEHIFEKKAWLNIKQKSFNMHIPIDKTILRLFSLHAPDPVLISFLNKVEDPARRLALARNVKSKKGIIDALVGLKDRTELENYQNTLAAGTEERFYAENALKTFNNKWKSDAIKLIK